MRFRNKSPFLATAKACVRRAAEKIGLIKPEPTEYEHTPKGRSNRFSRKERIANAKLRAERYRTRMTLNRFLWIRSSAQAKAEKRRMIEQGKGNHRQVPA